MPEPDVKTTPAPSPVDGQLPNRVEALYDCDGDEEDELSFVTGETIAVIGMSVIGGIIRCLYHFVF